MARRFRELTEDYGRYFVVHGRDVSQHARSYLSGLLGTQRRKNIGRIGEDVEASNYQGMQQLISDSPWDEQALMDQVAGEANGLLGGHRHSALYLDETSFIKKGNASVGVQRQYCGRVGKLENCQVGVFGCLGRGEQAALVDARLFLSEEWSKDAERCEKAKVPASERVHRTKGELARLIVERARQRGLNFQWIGGDEIYGNNKPLTDALEDMGEIFLMDINSNHGLYEEDPCPQPKQERPGLRGWHHHIALVCLAMLFVLKERLLAAEHTPLLSARDIVELLAYYLPRRNRSEDQIFYSMQLRHHQRARDITLRRTKRKTSVTK
jgi:SRSO17 transposase